MRENPKSITPMNHSSIVSLLLAAIALVSFCIGAAPLPLTALFCYPSSVLLGIGALWMGLRGLRQMRESQENGRALAKIGIWVGSLTILFVVCAVALVIILGPYVVEILQNAWNRISIE